MKQHLTFREILEMSRLEAATIAWDRGEIASRLRHELARSGNLRDASLMGEIKARCLARAAEILPEQVRVTIDDDLYIGLVSVRFRGRGRLHLAADALRN
jgi:hypothetical protein